MNRIQKALVGLANRLVKTAGYTESFDPMNHGMVGRVFGNASTSGKVVNESTAMQLTTAWSCMRILAEAIGAMPYGVFEGDGSNAVRVKDHPLDVILNSTPNVDMTKVEFKEAKALNLCQSGNAYALKETLAGEVVSLYPVPSSAMQTAQAGPGVRTTLALRDGTVFYRYNDRGRWTDLPRERVWHSKGFGNGTITGLSPLGAAREAMGFALSLDEFGSRFFSQGGKPSGVVTVPGWLKDDQREIARENLNQMLGGVANMHKFALFEGGMKPEPWGEMPLKDMELLLLKKFSVSDICRIYRVPPHMVADIDRGASYASIEQMSAEFVMFTLLPYFTRLEASADRWLFTQKDRQRGLFLRFNFEGLLRPDSKGRAEFYNSALQNGWMTRNEVRAKENLNRADGLDDYTVQMNMAPVGMLGDLARAAAKRGGSGSPQEPPKELVVREPAKAAPQPIVLVQVSPPSITFSPVIEGAKLTAPAVDFSKMPAPVVNFKAGDTTVQMPETTRFVVEGLGEFMTSQALAGLALGDETRKALESVRQEMARPRRIVTKDGEPVGTEPVDRL
jgi:HK97 family phage portal protein